LAMSQQCAFVAKKASGILGYLKKKKKAWLGDRGRRLLPTPLFPSEPTFRLLCPVLGSGETGNVCSPSVLQALAYLRKVGWAAELRSCKGGSRASRPPALVCADVLAVGRLDCTFPAGREAS